MIQCTCKTSLPLRVRYNMNDAEFYERFRKRSVCAFPHVLAWTHVRLHMHMHCTSIIDSMFWWFIIFTDSCWYTLVFICRCYCKFFENPNPDIAVCNNYVCEVRHKLAHKLVHTCSIYTRRQIHLHLPITLLVQTDPNVWNEHSKVCRVVWNALPWVVRCATCFKRHPTSHHRCSPESPLRSHLQAAYISALWDWQWSTIMKRNAVRAGMELKHSCRNFQVVRLSRMHIPSRNTILP